MRPALAQYAITIYLIKVYRTGRERGLTAVSEIQSVGTYVPPWRHHDRRGAGPDENALTMAGATGRPADPNASADRVVKVARDFSFLGGGNRTRLLSRPSLTAAGQGTAVRRGV